MCGDERNSQICCNHFELFIKLEALQTLRCSAYPTSSSAQSIILQTLRKSRANLEANSMSTAANPRYILEYVPRCQ